MSGVKKLGSYSTAKDGPCPILSPKKQAWIDDKRSRIDRALPAGESVWRALDFLESHTNRDYWFLVLETRMELGLALQWARDCARQGTWGFHKADIGEHLGR